MERIFVSFSLRTFFSIDFWFLIRLLGFFCSGDLLILPDEHQKRKSMKTILSSIRFFLGMFSTLFLFPKKSKLFGKRLHFAEQEIF